MNEHIYPRTKGHLTIDHVFADGHSITAMECHNALQQVGWGTMARCLATPGLSLNTMYLLYTNGDIPGIVGVEDGSVTVPEITTTSATLNFFRVPIVHVATDSTEGLGDNIVTFHGVTDGDPFGEPGTAAFGGSSRLYAAALVCAVDDNIEHDLLFSVADGIDITKIANAQIGIRWKVTVGLGEESGA